MRGCVERTRKGSFIQFLQLFICSTSIPTFWSAPLFGMTVCGGCTPIGSEVNEVNTSWHMLGAQSLALKVWFVAWKHQHYLRRPWESLNVVHSIPEPSWDYWVRTYTWTSFPQVLWGLRNTATRYSGVGRESKLQSVSSRKLSNGTSEKKDLDTQVFNIWCVFFAHEYSLSYYIFYLWCFS